ncbi:helix-turn-helix domain-containing protein [Nitrosomonas oligotropha]|uniref:helix-turn-helix domain-containing protein n=1 Tax=Nitrosomonas oligotropha TaxID=42354 RepID=UPI00136B8244|nr:helix-turn-helix domain-containing protein [Nitrosomonas oligotropha]MXS81552.1 XRE family transcriptional regulator [Nitrosomonas oligotropha]
MSTLADRVKECLEEQPDKTQIGLAKACGISPPSVSDWVTGKTKSMQAENLIPASTYLNVDPHWLATGIGKKRKTLENGDLAPQEKPRSEIKRMLVQIIDSLSDKDLTFDLVRLIKEALMVKKKNIPQSTDVLFVINHPKQEYELTERGKSKEANGEKSE